MNFSYRPQGPSGRGAKRVRYLVDASDHGSVAFYIGTLEGFGQTWTHDDGRKGRTFKSRKDAAEDLARKYHQRGQSWIFILAIVKSLIEHQDSSSYFGSTMGLASHAQDAIQRGLVEAIPEMPFYRVTDAGRKLYGDLGLDRLPQKRLSRAYMWDWEKALGPAWITKLPV